MAKRKPRATVTLDGEGHDLGGMGSGASGDWGTPFVPQWFQSSDPDVMKALVPAGTAPDLSITGISVSQGFPDASTDTWYAPTAQALSQGRYQAAIQTIQETGAKLADAGGQALNVLSTITQNFPLILLGLGALYLFLNYGGQHHGD